MIEASRIRRFVRILEDVASLDYANPRIVDDVRDLKIRALLALSPKGRAKGNPEIQLARQRAVRARQESAQELRRALRPVIADLRRQGVDSYRAIAKALDDMGIVPPRAKTWSANSVRRIELKN